MRRLLLALPLALLLAAPARAASVSLVPTGSPAVASALTFLASPGEANRVTVTGEDTGGALVTDSGAPLSPGTGCTAIDVHSASCQPVAGAPIDTVNAVLGDQGDAFTASTAPGAPWSLLSVSGGSGNDLINAAGVQAPELSDRFFGVEISGGPGNDFIAGSPGSDYLAGGSGRDVIHGLGGDDTLDGDGTGENLRGFDSAASDLLDGGPGEDTVTYAGHARGVNVDLTRPNRAGRPGENDRLSGIEDVVGSAFSDVLRGDRRANVLSGFQPESFVPQPRGGDVIDGRGGNDTLAGTGRADTLTGGAGNDTLVLGGGGDRFDCGAGTDTEAPSGFGLLVPSSCERVDDGAATFGTFRFGRGRLRATVSPDGDATACPETLSIGGHGGPRYGATAWADTPPPVLAIALNGAGRRAVRRHGTAMVRTQDCTGGPVAWLVGLR